MTDQSMDALHEMDELDEVLFETRHHTIIFIRPLIALLSILTIMVLCALVTPIIYGGVGCISLLLILVCLFLLVRELWHYQQGRFVITAERLFIQDNGRADEWPLNTVEGIDNLEHERLPYPLTAKTLRIRNSAGKTSLYRDVAQADTFQQTAYRLIAQQQSNNSIAIDLDVDI